MQDCFYKQFTFVMPIQNVHFVHECDHQKRFAYPLLKNVLYTENICLYQTPFDVLYILRF